MQIDKTKSAKQNLIDLVNLSNSEFGSNIAINQVELSSVSSYVDVDDPNVNSKITLQAVLGNGLSGSQEVYYTRIGLMDSISVPIRKITDDFSQSTSQAVFNRVVEDLNLVASEVQLTQILIPNQGLTTGYITISAKSDSILYVGDATIELIHVPV